jgi:hypothetical protein
MTSNQVGRPTDYRAEHCDTVIQLGLEGYSYTQIARSIGVAKSTLYEWKAAHPEFSDALTRARELAQAWWEDIGRTQMIAPVQGFSASLFAKQVSCRFPEDYTEKTKQEISGSLIQRVERAIVKPDDNAKN